MHVLPDLHYSSVLMHIKTVLKDQQQVLISKPTLWEQQVPTTKSEMKF